MLKKNNYFPMPNEIFCLGLNSGEIAVYTYLMSCEDRKTYQCYPSCGRIIHYELGFKNFDYHSLRHTHATMLIENGAPIKDVQHRLVHKSVQVTLDIYAHVTTKMQNQTIDVLNQLPAEGIVPNDEKIESIRKELYAMSEQKTTDNGELDCGKRWHKNAGWGTIVYP